MPRAGQIKLTKRVLETIVHACAVGLAGEEDEGDWKGVRAEDLERTKDWAHQQLAKIEQRRIAKGRAVFAAGKSYQEQQFKKASTQ